MRSRFVHRVPDGAEPAVCAFCGFGTFKGLATAMSSVLPNGRRVHVDRKVCAALQNDEELKKKVVEREGAPASVQAR